MVKWDLDLWYELWDRAGSQGLDTWHDIGYEPDEIDPPDVPLPRAVRTRSLVVYWGKSRKLRGNHVILTYYRGQPGDRPRCESRLWLLSTREKLKAESGGRQA
ncbi:MAG: hypothetical protein ACRDTR_19580 [Rubrobacter sp.]